MSGFFRLQPSLIFSAVLFSGYFLALLIVFMLPVTLVAGMLCAFLLVSALLYYLCRDAWLLLSSSPVAIRVEGKEVTLLTHGGNEYQGMILCSSVVTPALTILNILSTVKKGATHHVVIFPDTMSKAQFRELRVLLRWGA